MLKIIILFLISTKRGILFPKFHIFERQFFFDRLKQKRKVLFPCHDAPDADTVAAGDAVFSLSFFYFRSGEGSSFQSAP